MKKIGQHFVNEDLVLIWKRILAIDSLKEDDNFFAIGGHSLLAIDVLNEIEKIFAVKLNMKDLVEAPTIAQLAPVIARYQKIKKTKVQLDLNKKNFPLTLNQKQVWSLNVLYPESVTHNISTAIRIKKKLDIVILNKAINTIVARQESLRTRFKTHQGVPYQEVIPSYQFAFHFIDITEAELKPRIQKEMKHIFKLDEAPLMKIMFFKLGEEDFVFFFLVHHIVWDGLSNTFFFHEFIELYKSLSEGTPLELPEIRMTYKEHALMESSYLTSDEFYEQRDFWKNELMGELPILNLPTDFKRPQKINNESETLYFEIDQELLNKLERFVQQKYLSLYNVFIAVYNILLGQLSESEEVVVGTPVHGRHHRESRKTFGYFINTLPIRTKLHVNQSFKDNLSAFMEALKNAFYHQNIPLDILIQNASFANDSGRTPLFQTLFIYLDVTKELDVFQQEKLEQVKVERYSVHTEIDFYLYKSRNKVEGVIEYRKDLYKKESMKKMSELFISILTKVVENEAITLKELGHRQNPETKQFPLLDERPYKDFLDEQSFVKIFEENVLRHPEKIAIKTSARHMTYRELNEAANSLAHELIKAGVSANSLVGVSVHRNKKMLISLLAVVKAGAAYVPLDPHFPDERLQYMIERSHISTLLLEDSLVGRFDYYPHKIIVDEVLARPQQTTAPINVPISLDQLCYVLFTSGSTGKPKGVKVSHLNVLNFLLSMQKEPGLQSNDNLLSVTTFSFDISVLELFLPLITGSSIFLANDQQIINGEELAKTIVEENITCMQATPSTWRLLLASAWEGKSDLKILCGGEPLPRDLVNKLTPLTKEIWNMYGPTETTVWSTIKKVSSNDKKITIGRPIDNTCVYILDDKLAPCPIGTEGDLYIGGLGVSMGYIEDLEQTKKRFIPNPFRKDEIIYHTGDLARFLPSGEIECLGRSDDQVKIRGFRIELGEIETAVLTQKEIAECAAKVHGNKIIAYAVLNPAVETSSSTIKENIKHLLPHYMLPHRILFLEALPKTLNGKIDKKQLEEKLSKKADFSTTILADSEIITTITKIWQQVLGADQIEPDENFFNLGGHSIAAVEIFGMINDHYHLNLPLSLLFNAGTIRELALFVESANIKKEEELSALKCVVAIKPVRPNQEIIFCFHGVGGNVLNYYPLAEHVGDRAFYGVQALGVNGEDQIKECIHEMAQIYIEEIKKVQPKGPYLLSGGSMGGMIALEVALQLKAQGEEIKFLGMFDTVGPNLDFKTFGEVKVSFFNRMKNSLIFKMEKFINFAKVKFYLLTKASIPHSVRYFSIENKNFVALRRYRPQIFEGNITLIRAPRKDQGFYADPYLGWRNTINGKIETIEVEGDHQSFIESPSMCLAFKKVLEKI